MKVKGPGGPKTVDKTKKSGQSNTSGGLNFGSMLVSTASEAEQTVAAKTVSRVDVLLAAQAAEDPAERSARKRMGQRAKDILDALDTIKMALLNGNLRFSHLENITHMIAVNRERIDDPQLSYLLDEIDLRAQVEIAKLEAARDAAIAQMQTA